MAGRVFRAGLVVAAAMMLGLLPFSASASDLKIRSPIIDFHEVEFENNLTSGDSRNLVSELEYGFTDRLKLGVEAELAADPGHGFHYDAAALEGFLQFAPHGKYWADVGLFAEYEHTARTGDPRSLTIGPMVQKEARLFGLDTLHTVNAFLEKDMGAGSVGPPGLFVAARSLALVNRYVNPGFEYYGRVTLGEHGEEGRHSIGPAFAGRVGFRELGISAPGGIRYDAAYLRGLTATTDTDTFRIRVELEFPL